MTVCEMGGAVCEMGGPSVKMSDIYHLRSFVIHKDIEFYNNLWCGHVSCILVTIPKWGETLSNATGFETQASPAQQIPDPVTLL